MTKAAVDMVKAHSVLTVITNCKYYFSMMHLKVYMG